MEFTKDIEFNTNPVATKNITITYRGFLKNSETLSIVYGFGSEWQNTTEQKMTKTDNGFLATLSILDFDTFNFCFKDNNNIWDNNNNCNYISPISPFEKEIVPEFNIHELIKELSKPVSIKIEESPATVNLVTEISEALSSQKIIQEPETDFFSLEDFFALEEPEDLFTNENISENKSENTIETVKISENTETEGNSLILSGNDTFIVSSRQLSRFYLIKKRIRYALYKAFIRIPKMIFGLE